MKLKKTVIFLEIKKKRLRIVCKFLGNVKKKWNIVRKFGKILGIFCEYFRKL